MESQYREMARRMAQGISVARMTRFGQAYQVALADDLEGWRAQFGFAQEKVPFVYKNADMCVLFEMLGNQKKLVVCGGGHVSVPVVQLGKMLGYQVIVLDDRKEFANPKRFPQADAVICTQFEMLGNFLTGSDVSVVIVTRGHVADLVCLRQALQYPLQYIGMIGSRKKNQALFEVLQQEGISEAALKSVHAPIGLDIGAETPEEIAVAIAGEWIATRTSCSNAGWPQEMVQALADGATGIMATVIQKEGSAPRGLGARMFFAQDGRQFGSVGGGLAEYAVCEQAKKLLQAPKQMQMQFSMQNGEAGKSGMICGGKIEILFEVVD